MSRPFQTRDEALRALESARRYLADERARNRTANDLWWAVAEDGEAELLRDAVELRIALREAAVQAVTDQPWVRGAELPEELVAKDLARLAFAEFSAFIPAVKKWREQAQSWFG